MLIALHKNARTTHTGHPRGDRRQQRQCRQPGPALWHHPSHRLQVEETHPLSGQRAHGPPVSNHTLSPARERVVAELRRTLLLPLDDLLAVTREFICAQVSRSGLDRCLRRHGVGNLNDLKPAPPREAHKSFKSYEPGYLHMDVKYLPQMAKETQRRYLFVAIDRATRWVFVAIKRNKTAASAKSFLNAMHKACPLKIRKLLTDNGKEFTDRLFASRERKPTG